jgi:hypothetical protein
MSTERVAVSTNTPEIINRMIAKAICKIRVLPRERTFMSSPPSTRGMIHNPIIAYERYIFVFTSRANPSIESSRVRFCTRNAARPVRISIIHSMILAILICLSVGRFMISPSNFIIVFIL